LSRLWSRSPSGGFSRKPAFSCEINLPAYSR